MTRQEPHLFSKEQEVGIPLSGNTVLNVGFGFGLNTEAMSSMGAKVFGVEPDTGPTTRPTYLVLLMAGAYGVDARGSSLPRSPSISGTNIDTAEALHTATINHYREDRTLLLQNNYNGWANPEDLAPIPQCIAQQD
ncbi:uncharacterized protein EURHEDRAFT_406032 [Aspergillus ruber CBS 135680]|uniref:Uncharacterized protein n=1 Tax=Aspergillus ruber (strain CBS 135680) TaxID=1388766 RepID=A0A017S417_ASPRC|nr:uncharacterized protein EURHEDRAFT_406032 [Aspergillus ruber CBS 135680]EYE91546.1 hypothetical protein EURHEDRAFT_406032 [Aspergillus ruber CBS 135680]